MVRAYVVFFFCIITIVLSSQERFYQSYDLFNHATESGTSVLEMGNQIYISGIGLCDNFNSECHVFAEFSLNGDIVDRHSNSEFKTGRGLYIQNDKYFVCGTSEPLRNHFVLYRRNLTDGDVKRFDIDISGEGFYGHHCRGLVSIGSNDFIIFGQVTDSLDLDENNTPKVKGVIARISSTGIIINLKVLDPPGSWMRFEDCKLNSSGELLLLSEYSITLENGFQARKKRLISFDINLNENYIWDSDLFTEDLGIGSISISGNKRLISIIDSEGFTISIICINEQGTLGWRFEFDHGFQNKYSIKDLSEAKSGDILGCGSIESFGSNPGRSGILFKLSPNGQLQWLRKYHIDRGQHPLLPNTWAKTSWFNCVTEANNGDIISCGRVYNYYDDPILGPRDDVDIFLIRTNSTGCFDDFCEDEMELNVQKNDQTTSFIYGDPEWSVLSSFINGEQSTTRYRFQGDSVEISNRFYHRLYINLSEDSDNWEPSDLLYREEMNSIYTWDAFNGEVLRYDFSLEPGDTITTQNFAGEIFLVVASVDSITLFNGEKRKRLKLYCQNDPMGNIFGFQTWIEGIGSIFGSTFDEDAVCSFDQNKSLLCFSIGDEVQYENEVFNNCFITSTIQSPTKPPYELSPNPVYNYIHVKNKDENEKLDSRIFNLNGIQIKSTNSNPIDVSDLHPGLYIIQINTEHSSLFIKPF